MNGFKEANQARLALKMQLSNFHTYRGSSVIVSDDKYIILLHFSKPTKKMKNIPSSLNGVKIKIDVNQPSQMVTN